MFGCFFTSLWLTLAWYARNSHRTSLLKENSYLSFSMLLMALLTPSVFNKKRSDSLGSFHSRLIPSSEPIPRTLRMFMKAALLHRWTGRRDSNHLCILTKFAFFEASSVPTAFEQFPIHFSTLSLKSGTTIPSHIRLVCTFVQGHRKSGVVGQLWVTPKVLMAASTSLNPMGTNLRPPPAHSRCTSSLRCSMAFMRASKYSVIFKFAPEMVVAFYPAKRIFL